MAMPTTPDSWTQSLELPTRLFGRNDFGGTDYELYEEDGEFVLSVEAPGFEPDEIDLSWHDGVLNVAAEHADEDRGRKRTYHRRFRFPKGVDADDITASYRNGVLEVRLPVRDDGTTHGKSIPVEG